MKCQVNKKDNSRCDKESSIVDNNISMCKQHYKAFLKNKIHQYGTTNDEQQEFDNLTIREYLFSRKIPLSNLSD